MARVLLAFPLLLRDHDKPQKQPLTVSLAIAATCTSSRPSSHHRFPRLVVRGKETFAFNCSIPSAQLRNKHRDVNNFIFPERENSSYEPRIIILIFLLVRGNLSVPSSIYRIFIRPHSLYVATKSICTRWRYFPMRTGFYRFLCTAQNFCSTITPHDAKFDTYTRF